MTRYLPTSCGQVVAVQSEQALILSSEDARCLLADLRRWQADFTGTHFGPAYREWADDLEAALSKTTRLALVA